MKNKLLILASLIIFLILITLINIFIKNNFIGKGFVTVKGAAEISVTADMAYWTISFVNTGNDLSILKNKNKDDLNIIIEFLKTNNLKESEYKIIPLELADMEAKEYKDPNQNNRYILTQSVSIITDRVDLVENINQKLDYLIDKNISIKSAYGEMKPIYKFTKINSIKQEMLKEATINAKKTAEQFAANSNTKVGKIKYANQGIFNIVAKNKSLNYIDNEAYEKEKEIRVVVTIDYWLN